MARVVLLYSPNGAAPMQAALVARGWAVRTAATLAEGRAAIGDGTIDLVVMDDPSWVQARELIAMLDASPALVPRLWVSSWPEAPVHSGKLGIDALLLDPRDLDGIATQVARFFEPRHSRSGTHPLFAAGSSPSVKATAPRAARGSGTWDDETTGEWP
ncbi:MAG: hypothetical protein IPL61_08785 [Myxococcales bacterium]|nr:hypothetical protein [Myxococcales bacterium]